MPRTLTATERSFIAQMPKAELHVHIEGSVRPETLLDLGRKHGVTFPFDDVAGIREWFRFRDFPHFIEVYVAGKQALRTVDDYAWVAREMAEDAARQGSHYLEVTFAPAVPGDTRAMAPGDVILAGLREGAREARDRYGIGMQFICDPVRGRPPEVVRELARWTVDNLGDGLVGFGLGGVEVGNPPSRYQEAFDLARRGGARLTVHAGETVGPESVWEALAIGSERIGHGVRSIEDPALVAELAARQVVLEVSPTSNICLGVYPDYAAHSFRALHEAGVAVTVNSDDPPMFNTTLLDEYFVLAEQFGFSLDELAAFSLRAVDAAFLPDAERTALRRRFEDEIAALRGELLPSSFAPGG